jgi:hypothetical protein
MSNNELIFHRLPTAEGHGSVYSGHLHIEHHNQTKEFHMSVPTENAAGYPWRNAAAGIVASFLTSPSGRPR